jgi:hypothetical protein
VIHKPIKNQSHETHFHLNSEGNISLVNVEGCHQIFSEVNMCVARAGKPPMFKVQIGWNQEGNNND